MYMDEAGDWQTFILEVVILSVNMNYAYWVVNFSFLLVWNLSSMYLYYLAATRVFQMLQWAIEFNVSAIWSQSTFQLFLVGMIET